MVSASFGADCAIFAEENNYEQVALMQGNKAPVEGAIACGMWFRDIP